MYCSNVPVLYFGSCWRKAWTDNSSRSRCRL